jgi:hypothetical protein
MTLHTALSWLGSYLQIVGALALAARWIPPRIAYGVMLPGAALWLDIAVHGHDWALAAMQAVFAAINTVGILRWRAV